MRKSEERDTEALLWVNDAIQTGTASNGVQSRLQARCKKQGAVVVISKRKSALGIQRSVRVVVTGRAGNGTVDITGISHRSIAR